MKRTYQTEEMQLKYQLNYIARAGGTSAANVTVSVLQDAKRRFFDHRSVIFNPLTCALLPGVVSHRGRLHEGRMMTLELKNRCCFCVPQRSTECISWGGVAQTQYQWGDYLLSTYEGSPSTFALCWWVCRRVSLGIQFENPLLQSLRRDLCILHSCHGHVLLTEPENSYLIARDTQSLISFVHRWDLFTETPCRWKRRVISIFF